MAEAMNASRPERVGTVILAAFDELGGQSASTELVRALSSGTRAWLLLQAMVAWSGDAGWFEASCNACMATFDFPLRLSELPRGEAGPGYPVVTVDTSLGARSFEVPNGGHEVALSRWRGNDPVRELVTLIGLARTAAADASRFTQQDLTTIERAIEAVAPDIADHVVCTCPECAAELEVAIDPIHFALPRAEAILADVHALARAYGWSERAILTLPVQRRRSYAALIRADGLRERGHA